MDLNEAKAVIITERYHCRTMEINWRGVQRDGCMALAVAATGTASLSQILWALLTVPVPLLFLSAVWLHHDRRIGKAADYLRRVVEPAMAEIDGLEGYESFLDQNDPDRSRDCSRFSTLVPHVFAVFAGAAVALGVLKYALTPDHDGITTLSVVASSIIGLAITVMTWIKVKHDRFPLDP